MIFNAYSEGLEQVDGITLVSCGHIFAQSGREINRPCGRDDWLLFYVASGDETFYFDRAVTAGEGAFVIFAPGEKQHHIYEGGKTAEFYYVHFRCEGHRLSLKTSTVYRLPFKRHICDIFERIIDETLKKQPFYERLCIHSFLALMTELERGVLYSDSTANGGFDRIAAAVQHMNRYCEQELSLADYAAMCNMSKYHFLRVFTKVVGSTPLDYRNNIRLERAAELLREEALSVQQTAQAVGFASASYFSTAFKKKYGVCPKNYPSNTSVTSIMQKPTSKA